MSDTEDTRPAGAEAGAGNNDDDNVEDDEQDQATLDEQKIIEESIRLESERRIIRDQAMEDDEAAFARALEEALELSKVSALEDEKNREYNLLRIQSQQYSSYTYNIEEKVETEEDNRSLYERAVGMSEKISDGQPIVYKLKGREIGGNKQRKVRRLAYGPPNDDMRERTILVVGETGSGKSTLIDSLANYVMGVKEPEEPARFKIVDVLQDEKKSDQTVSQTDWITCYSINKMRGGPVPCNINIIDTPGFGDTRGIKEDERIVNQIQNLFENREDYNIQCLDAVCLVIKCTVTRLTATQKYIFESLMKLFGKDLGDNIIMLGTFSDGSTPEALASMKKGDIPYKENFNFNNTALVGNPQSLIIKSFWEMMIEGWKKFFETLGTLTSRSLTLTVEVLSEREFLQDCVVVIVEQIKVGLTKMSNLKNFTKISEYGSKDVPVKYVQCTWQNIAASFMKTNCSTCKQTCIQREVRMRPGEKCKLCKCCKPHQIEKSTWTCQMEDKMITIQELKNSYKVQDARQLEAKLTKEYQDVKEIVDANIMRMRESNRKLHEIALRPRNQSVVEYVNLMIETEKKGGEKGWSGRVSELQQMQSHYKTMDKYLDPHFQWIEPAGAR